MSELFSTDAAEREDLATPAREGEGAATSTEGRDETALPELPKSARLPINRCSLPAAILGGLTFQRYPSQLTLDGVEQLHGRLFHEHLPALASPELRAARFMDYLDVAFRLYRPEDAGWEPHGPKKRIRATYLQLIRGWSVDANEQEAAVLKGWVESRFGLRARFHGAPLDDGDGAPYAAYMAARARGLFATNAVESQLDLLYAYCQYELHREAAPEHRLRLYRGVDRVDEASVVASIDRNRCIMLLNNLSSFSAERERAEEFGYYVLAAEVPRAKILFYNRLLPRMLTGEDEYMVIGGLYEVERSLF